MSSNGVNSNTTLDSNSSEVDDDSKTHNTTELPIIVPNNVKQRNMNEPDFLSEDEDDEVRAHGSLEFNVPNIARLKEKVLSPLIYLRGLPWKILIMQRSSCSTVDSKVTKHLGYFLQCNTECNSANWFCVARADLRIKAHRAGCDDVVKKIVHTFCARENDWGFSSFLNWTDLMSSDRGLIASDGSIHLRVDISAEAPHGVNWDSKRHTGYVGLHNQGATCYMNSLLQTLFFTNKLRRAVYKMPTESDDPQRSVALALQRVFYDLQFTDKSVVTKNLTRSFGWETLDSFMQHDVQELSRVLLDNMEEKMKGTGVEGTIPSLFEGKMLSYVRCKNVDFYSEREENYYDIQLNVKDKKDIYESFQEYVAIETLDGDNKYDAGHYGLQEAEKGVKFLTFPPVLHLQLLRFQYDPLMDCNVKINDCFEFPYVLNLAGYLAYPDEENSSGRYLLHAVLVHSGDNHGGHYVVYINPALDGRWARFDDDVVSRVSRVDAIDQNFGGLIEGISVKQFTSAYMLVYVRESDRDDVLEPVLEEDIPKNLVDRLKHEKLLEMQLLKDKREAYLYIDLYLVLEEDFKSWYGIDLCDLEHIPERVLRVKKSTVVGEISLKVAQELELPITHVRIWLMSRRKTHAFRIIYINSREYSLKNISTFAEDQQPLYLWVQTLSSDQDQLESLPHFDKEDDLLIFLKYYDVRQNVTHYCGHLQLPMNVRLSSITDECIARAKLAQKSSLVFWEERNALNIELIKDPNQSVEKCVAELMDGNIIIFQLRVNTTLPSSMATGTQFPSVRDYFYDLYNRIEVHFINKDVVNEEFTIEFSHKATYDDLSRGAAQHLGCSPDMLQFNRAHESTTIGVPIKCTYEGTLRDLFGLYNARSKVTQRLFYSRLKMKLSELETLQTYRCVWVSSRLREERELELCPPRSGCVRDLLLEARRQVELSASGSGQLRLLEVVTHKIIRQQAEDVALAKLANNARSSLHQFRIEEVPMNEVNLAPDEFIVCVAHFTKETYATFGVPFTLKISENENFSVIRERIQRRLDVPDAEFETWRFALVGADGQHGHSVTPIYFQEEDDIQRLGREHFFGRNSDVSSGGGGGGVPDNALFSACAWIGLDHLNKQPKRPRVTYVEKAIKIHN